MLLACIAVLTLGVPANLRGQGAPADPCAADPDPFACRRHGEWRRTDAWPGRVVREDGSLALRLDGGRGLTLQDGPQGEPPVAGGAPVAGPNVVYVFRDYLPRVNAYVVELTADGRHAFLLVEAASGRRTVLDGEPVFSPDGARFVEASQAGGKGSEPGQVSVWRMDAGGPVREFQWRATPAEPWDPADPVWTSASAIRLVRRIADPAGLSLRETAVALRLTPAGWQLSPAR
jgi:hypothetical protein